MQDLFRTVADVAHNYSATVYTVLAIILVLLWLALTIVSGPAGMVFTGPCALLALILRKLDQILRSRS